MPSRVGITTNPESRRKHWESRVEGLINWRILTSFQSQSEAQRYENDYAARHNCNAWPGGPDTPGTWYVYFFDYTRDLG